MSELEIQEKWLGKRVRIDNLYMNGVIEIGDQGTCKGIIVDLEGSIFLDVEWDNKERTSWKESRHSLV